MTTHYILGIDIAKAKFDVALFINNKYKTKVFDNNNTGFKALSEWLTKHAITTSLHACMEATNRYGQALATYLFNAKFTVSVVNPAQIKAFSNSALLHNKTDKLDAKTIAHFCLAMQPRPWTPPPAHIADLQALVQRLNVLIDLQTQEKNRLTNSPIKVKASIKTVIKTLEKQIQSIQQQIHDHINSHPDLKQKSTLLRSIKGVGPATVATVLAFLPAVENFTHVNQVVAFAGLNPQQKSSGTSLKGKTPLSKIGHANLRRALYFPAIVALRFNTVFKALAERLTAKLKTKMTIVGAAMRKLLVIIYGVLKSNQPFNPDLAMPKFSK